MFVLRLYIAGGSLHSMNAIGNLRAFCDEQLAGRYELELVDVLVHPRRALDDRVLLTPTLVKLSPTPVRRIVGNLSETAVLARALGLQGS